MLVNIYYAQLKIKKLTFGSLSDAEAAAAK